MKTTDAKIKFTDSQYAAVNENGDILVTASAGSGKTFVMIERILENVAAGVPISRILVLVFNNATATELRQKISNRLLEKIPESGGETKRLFKAALDEMPFSHIGTLDSFCLSLVREHFEVLGVSPSANVSDGAEFEEYCAKAQKAMVELFGKAEDDSFDRLVSMFSAQRSEDQLFSVIRRIYELISIQPDGEEFAKTMKKSFESLENNAFSEQILNYYRNRAQTFLDFIYALVSNLKVDGQIEKADAMIGLAENAKRIQRCASLKELSHEFSIFETPDKMPRSKKDSDKSLGDAAVEVNKAYKKMMLDGKQYLSDYERLEFMHGQNRLVFEKIAEAAEIFGQKLKDLMHKDEKYSFGDVERLAVELMRGAEGEAVKSQFDRIFVDEYQDINPIQEFLINSLSNDGGAFMVGDPKQSIYGFRMADPNISLGRMERYASGAGKNISLNCNFRSSKKIVDFVNAVFDAVMTKETCGVDYKNTSRLSTDKTDDCASSAEIHLFAEPKSFKREFEGGVYKLTESEELSGLEKAAAAEGKFIAEKIKAMVGKEILPDGRKMDYGDVAVLYRSAGAGVKKICEVLQKYGVPLSDPSLFEPRDNAVRELVVFLKAIDNPTVDIDFAGFLLSYFGGFSENELARIKTAYPSGSLADACKSFGELDGELAAKVRNALAFVENYRLKASFKNVRELLENLILDTEYGSYLSAKGGEEKAEVYAMLASLSGKEYNASVHRFLKAYPYASKTSSDASSAVSRSKVTVQTIHKSKGLEYPAVFVVDIEKKFSSRSVTGDLLADGNGETGIMYFDEAKRAKCKTVSHIAAKIAIQNRERREEMRLFYVALTRAKQKLFLTGVRRNSESYDFAEPNSYLEFIELAIRMNSLDGKCVTTYPPSEDFVESSARLAPIFNAPRKEYVDEIQKQFDFRYPYAEATRTSQKFSVTALAENAAEYDAGDAAYEVFGAEDDGGAGRTRGVAYHKVMQLIDFETEDLNSVAEAVKSFAENGELTAEAAATVNAEDILRCLRSDLMKRAAKCVCEREKPFTMLVPFSEISNDADISDEVLVQGVIDLMFFENGKIVIVDFKNSRKSDEELKKTYAKQLMLYKKAAESAGLGEVEETYLYSFGSGRAVRV